MQNLFQAAFVAFNTVSMYNFNGHAGIEVANSVLSYVWMNNVNGIYKHTDQYGIYVDGGGFTSMLCNTTENAGIGIHMENTSDPQGVAKNVMDNNLRGLQLTACTAFDIGTTVNGYDNSWYGNDTYDTYTDNTDASGNKIYYSSAGYPLEPMINDALSSGDEFQVDNAANPLDYIECPEGVGTQKTELSGELFSQERMAAIILQALTDTVPSAIYPEERAWARRYHLYQVLDAREDLRNAHPAITAFFDSCQTANAGRLWQATKALHPAQLTQSAGSLSAQTTALDAISTSIRPEAALRDVLQVMTDHATDEQYETNSVMYIAQQHLQSFQTMESDGQPIPEMRIRRLSEHQYTTVVELAEQCPYEYGPAVYMARVLRQRNENLPRIYRKACENVDKRNEGGGVSGSPKDRSYRLYPNPNAGTFAIELSLQERETAQLQVWNLAGQQIHTQILGDGINTLDMDAAAKGLYWTCNNISDIEIRH